MSIATELTRIQGAKADLKTSIEAKGVTVPSATLISGYAALVDQIETGGAGIPDSDGLIDLEIVTGDQSGVSSFTLSYLPKYLLKYTPSSAVTARGGFTIPQTAVTYPNVVWSCDNPSLTISGSTVTVPTGTDGNVTFTATWTDLEGETRTTTKTINVVNLRYRMISLASSYMTEGYVVCGSSPEVADIRINGTSDIYLQRVEWYDSAVIAQCTYAGTYSWQWGNIQVLSNNGTSASVFSTVAEAKAAYDSRAT